MSRLPGGAIKEPREGRKGGRAQTPVITCILSLPLNPAGLDEAEPRGAAVLLCPILMDKGTRQQGNGAAVTLATL